MLGSGTTSDSGRFQFAVTPLYGNDAAILLPVSSGGTLEATPIHALSNTTRADSKRSFWADSRIGYSANTNLN